MLTIISKTNKIIINVKNKGGKNEKKRKTELH
mgnify:FL=1